MFHHVLLAYDGSQEGSCALRQGADLAKRLGADVTLLAVVAAEPGHLIADAVGSNDLSDHETQIYQDILDQGLADLAGQGLKASGRLAYGLPTREIAATARAIRADLIVVGHRRLGPLARWWSASVGASLLTDAPCSVLIAVDGGDHAR